MAEKYFVILNFNFYGKNLISIFEKALSNDGSTGACTRAQCISVTIWVQNQSQIYNVALAKVFPRHMTKLYPHFSCVTPPEQTHGRWWSMVARADRALPVRMRLTWWGPRFGANAERHGLLYLVWYNNSRYVVIHECLFMSTGCERFSRASCK